jgi:RNA polymerase sigma factor (sigma-70 family)
VSVTGLPKRRGPEVVWGQVEWALRTGAVKLSPAQHSALVQVLDLVPGVTTISGSSDPNGNPTIGFRRVQPNRVDRIFLDPNAALVTYSEGIAAGPKGTRAWGAPVGAVLTRYESLGFKYIDELPAGLRALSNASRLRFVSTCPYSGKMGISFGQSCGTRTVSRQYRARASQNHDVAPLLEQMLGGSTGKEDPRKFIDGLYRRHAVALLAFFARRTFDPQVAMDLTAETFATALEEQPNCRARTAASRKAWLYGIARNLLSNFYRRGEIELRAVTRLAFDAPVLSEDSANAIANLANLAAARQLMGQAMAGLSDQHREALRLRVIDERSYADVAEELGITEVTARARVNRALKSLRESLDDETETLKEMIENV